MLNLKSLVLGALLAVPMVSSAVTTTTVSLGGISDIGGAPTTQTATSNFTVVHSLDLPALAAGQSPRKFTDTWQLNVGASDIASISFATNNIQSLKILLESFDVTSTSLTPTITNKGGQTSYVFTNIPYLLSGYKFTVNGMLGAYATSGAYSVHTEAITAVPVPGAVWLLGTAMIGLFSFRKRNSVVTA